MSNAKDPSQKIVSLINEVNASLAVLSGYHNLEISSENIYAALTEHFNLDSSTELIDKDLDSLKIVSILRLYDFKKLIPIILAEAEFEGSNPFELSYGVLTEETVKHNNMIIRIHQNDADPFPNKIHGHLIGSGLKLDLSNGKVYHKRKEVDTIKRKHLIDIRKKFSSINLPSLCI